MASTDSILPIVDLRKAKDPAHRLAVATDLVKALETVGFLFLDNVDGYDSGKLLENTRRFFNLSQQEKRRLSRKPWNPQSQNYYRGYFPLQPGESSYKEGFEVGQGDKITEDTNVKNTKNVHPFFREPNIWPEHVEGEDFCDSIKQYYQSMLDCGAEILRLVSLGCGLEENWFKSMFVPNSLSTLRLLHYPPRPDVSDTARDGDTVLCCSEHSDSGFVTLLSTFSYSGLQIFNKEDGKWTDVPIRPNSIVMNIGDMLSALSGGRFKATVHRVVETGLERFSVPFFFEPHYHADVSVSIPSESNKQHHGPKKPDTHSTESTQINERHYGPTLIQKMRCFAEYRDILDNLD